MKVRLALAAASLTALALVAAGSAGASGYRVTGTATEDWWSGDLYSTAPVVTTFETFRFNEASGFHASGTEPRPRVSIVSRPSTRRSDET